MGTLELRQSISRNSARQTTFLISNSSVGRANERAVNIKLKACRCCIHRLFPLNLRASKGGGPCCSFFHFADSKTRIFWISFTISCLFRIPFRSRMVYWCHHPTSMAYHHFLNECSLIVTKLLCPTYHSLVTSWIPTVTVGPCCNRTRLSLLPCSSSAMYSAVWGRCRYCR